MLTNLEVSLADMYTGRTVEVSSQTTNTTVQLIDISFKYLEKSFVDTVMGLVHIQMGIYMNVKLVMDGG